jgi:hypothetical protein
MDAEGLDVAVLFRSAPLHTNENFEPEYAMDLCGPGMIGCGFL